MQERDNTFFEAYKRLDRLCADMYGGQNGVSQYLEDMERQPYRDRLAVPRWEESYKTLKHLRWVRNRIAHETGTVSVCEEQDLRDVTGFYNAILAGQDPLATLYRRRQARPAERPTPRTAPADAPYARQSPASRRPARPGWLLAVLLALAVAICLLVLFFNRPPQNMAALLSAPGRFI